MRHLMRLALCVFAALSLAYGQTCQIGAPLSQATACQDIYGYSGTNLIYQCRAKSRQPFYTRLSISAATNASPTSLTITAHGFNTSSNPTVVISGGTGNWAGLNGTHTATVTGTNSITVPIDTSAYGAVTGTLVLDTYAPITSASVWSVRKYVYDGSNNLIWSGWVGGTPAERNTCTATPAQAQ